MDATFQISEVFQTSWKHVKSQIWVLAGLVIGICLISFTINLFTLPLQGSTVGMIIAYLISLFISAIFSVGYIKNLFQTMEGDEPQFSAYLQSFPKIFNMLMANILFGIAFFIGLCFLVIPGIYLYLRLQFFAQFIVDEDAGAVDSLKQSWALTNGKAMPLLMLLLTQLLLLVIGIILFGVGVFVTYPIAAMMSCYVYRILNRVKVQEEIV